MKLTPLVEPASSMTNEEIQRYSRHILIPGLGLEGQLRLKAARVLVIGAGGLGSPVLLYLAAAGVGTIGVVDFDRVDLSNLQRQVIHDVDSIDMLKVQSAKRKIKQLNPLINVEACAQRLTSETAVALLSRYDLVLDGTDNFATRYLVNDACVLASKPCVWGSVFRFEGRASVFWEDAPDGLNLNYRDLYPEPPPTDSSPSCAQAGVFGVVCAAIGSIMTTEAIKLITGIGEPLLGRLMVYDALDMRYKEFAVRQREGRKPITRLEDDYEVFCAAAQSGTQQATLPLSVPTVNVLDLREMLTWDSSVRPRLIDIREPGEWEIVRIPGSVLRSRSANLPAELVAEFGQNARLIITCKSGHRSAQVVDDFLQMGLQNACSLQGGVLAWIEQIDPTLMTY